MKNLSILFIALLIFSPGWSQAPNGFKYQVVVRDGTGLILADQSVGFEMTILQDGPGGINVYQETHNTLTNGYGLVSLDIGGGTMVSGDFTTIDWGDGPYFLKIAIDETGGTSYTEMGTSELLSVPFAMYAKEAENVDDADADPTNEYNGTLNLTDTDLMLTDGGGTLIADLSSLVDADADSTNELISSFEILDDSLRITEADYTFTIPLDSLSDGDWIVSGENIYNPNTGFVGIGIADPLSKLHISDTLDDDNRVGTRLTFDNPDGTLSSAGLYTVLNTGGTGSSQAIQGNSYADESQYNRGVLGTAQNGPTYNRGVQGNAHGTSGTSNMGVVGFSDGEGTGRNVGTYGDANGNTLVNYGVYGFTDGAGSTINAGVRGLSNGESAEDNAGVWGTGENSTGLNIGVVGNTAGNGTTNIGVYGYALGTGGSNTGVYGYAANGTLNRAGFFSGDVVIAGNLDVSGTLSKGGGTFKIDHPLDPANKYLVHSFVESPEMLNVYSGNITTDSDGKAIVQLPEYFEASNKEFRYQLTVIGTFARAIVKEKITGNTFVIETDQPNIEVSWQVTGVRADNWSNANRVIPEQEKKEKGTYIHPELYNATNSQSIYKDDLLKEDALKDSEIESEPSDSGNTDEETGIE